MPLDTGFASAQNLPVLKPLTEGDDQQWSERLARHLRREQRIQAIRMDPQSRAAAYATLGLSDDAELRAALEEVLSAIGTIPEGKWEAPSGFLLSKDRGSLVLSRPSCMTSPRLWRWQDAAWPEVRHEEEEEDWRPLAIQATACACLGLGAVAAEGVLGLPDAVRLLLQVGALVAGGWDAAIDTWKGLLRRRVDIHFLMLLVAVGATLIGHWAEGALLLFLFSAAGALEAYALSRTRAEVGALMSAAPKEADQVLSDGSERSLPIDAVEAGMLLRVRPGALIPVDGEVVEGSTSVDESSLTGEAMPVGKEPGESVFGGTLNQQGSVLIRATRGPAASMIQRILRLVEQARRLKAPSERFTEKFGTGYTFVVLGVCFAAWLYWWKVAGLPALGGESSGSALYRAMTLLVVMSPCALVLSIPSAILAAIAAGARRGILYRSGAAVEKLAGIDTVCLDKTGTLTTGNLRVAQVESHPRGMEQDILESAAAVEVLSQHPLARAIVRHAKARGLEFTSALDFRSLPGAGASGTYKGRRVLLGKREVLETQRLGEWIRSLPDTPMEATEVWIATEDAVGRILLVDELRPEAAETLRELHAAGLRTVMLTGDRRAAAQQVAAKIGIGAVEAGLSPEDKVAAIRRLTREGRRVAMVGDGVNDAPSLAAAFVSVGMGSRGSDAALEQSEIVLMHDRIENFGRAHRLSLRARLIIRQNLALSLGTVCAMALASLLTEVPLTLGVLAHEGSTVLVCLNSLRLLAGRYHPPKTSGA